MSVSIETEKENKLSFLHVEIIREQGKFTTINYRKSTFSGAYSKFESLLPLVSICGMVYALVYRCFRIFSNWTRFHNELIFLRFFLIFLKRMVTLNTLLTNVLKSF